METDDYTLTRDYRASVRLHMQHHLWTEMFMYMLSPKIPITSPGLAIAEVGTGTGIWLLEVARRLPTPPSLLCGMDISNSQFPRPEWLPPATEFRTCDGLDPNGPPADLVRRFDIVHLRLWIAIVKNNDPMDLIRFCSKLLKPGGYLQWDEMEPMKSEAHSYDGSAVEGMNAIAKMCHEQKPTAWVPLLPHFLEKEGLFRTIDVDTRGALPWQRGWCVDNWCMLIDEFTERTQTGGPSINAIPDYYAKVPALTPKEKQQGSWVDQIVQIIVARKIE